MVYLGGVRFSGLVFAVALLGSVPAPAEGASAARAQPWFVGGGVGFPNMVHLEAGYWALPRLSVDVGLFGTFVGKTRPAWFGARIGVTGRLLGDDTHALIVSGAPGILVVDPDEGGVEAPTFYATAGLGYGLRLDGFALRAIVGADLLGIDDVEGPSVLPSLRVVAAYRF